MNLPCLLERTRPIVHAVCVEMGDYCLSLIHPHSMTVPSSTMFVHSRFRYNITLLRTSLGSANNVTDPAKRNALPQIRTRLATFEVSVPYDFEVVPDI